MAKKKTSNARSVRDYAPDWQSPCENCGSKPTLPVSGLCGPCHWGTADAVGGGWWDEATNDLDAEFCDEHIR